MSSVSRPPKNCHKNKDMAKYPHCWFTGLAQQRNFRPVFGPETATTESNTWTKQKQWNTLKYNTQMNQMTYWLFIVTYSKKLIRNPRFILQKCQGPSLLSSPFVPQPECAVRHVYHLVYCIHVVSGFFFLWTLTSRSSSRLLGDSGTSQPWKLSSLTHHWWNLNGFHTSSADVDGAAFVWPPEQKKDWMRRSAWRCMAVRVSPTPRLEVDFWIACARKYGRIPPYKHRTLARIVKRICRHAQPSQTRHKFRSPRIKSMFSWLVLSRFFPKGLETL